MSLLQFLWEDWAPNRAKADACIFPTTSKVDVGGRRTLQSAKQRGRGEGSSQKEEEGEKKGEGPSKEFFLQIAMKASGRETVQTTQVKKEIDSWC